MKPSTKQIEYMLLNGRARDLYNLMDQNTIYNIDNGDNYPKDRDQSLIYSLALNHVWFVSEFGLDTKEARVGDKFYRAHPENFDKWLSIGCVVLHQEELDAYFKAKPIE